MAPLFLKTPKTREIPSNVFGKSRMKIIGTFSKKVTFKCLDEPFRLALLYSLIQPPLEMQDIDIPQ